ncbi:MAG: hypothetical protein JWM16_3435, partial [Verrucomicrobiales bacterium]|nr:hypothetical protein [Verrucomicrobiales bacterium]
DGQGGAHSGMHGFDGLLALGATADIRLVGRNHEEVASRLQSAACFENLGINFEILDRLRWVRFAIPDDAQIDYAVAVQKHSSMETTHLNASFPTWSGWFSGSGAKRTNAKQRPEKPQHAGSCFPR